MAAGLLRHGARLRRRGGRLADGALHVRLVGPQPDDVHRRHLGRRDVQPVPHVLHRRRHWLVLRQLLRGDFLQRTRLNL